ncbi:MAG: Nif3-like dinuclear metal center hexameric protein [Flavobacteriales bacterium]|nr:Nif3-like dinuclear metal center hexameric protein [Flavobacteriales bacterium]
MTIGEITATLENWAPLSLQEPYDNAGLICGDPNWVAKKAIISIDITEDVVEEAIQMGANLIVAHHPIIFKGLKKLVGNTYVERTVIKAIRNDIALYATHTNLDNVHLGVNKIIGEKMDIHNPEILSPKSGQLLKLVTYCPIDHAEKIKSAMFDAGAGHIGKYDQCSFNTIGEGTFRALDGAQPHVGKLGEQHHEQEIKIEVILNVLLKNKVIKALTFAHPYEEVAYELYQIENTNPQIGSGMIGDLREELDLNSFLDLIKKSFDLKVIRHTKNVNRKIRKVAWCGGSGSFLLGAAIGQKADIFITGDFKYHEFFDAENQIVIADIGHYESEQFTMELIGDFLKRNFPKFAVRLTEVYTNPVIYY